MRASSKARFTPIGTMASRIGILHPPENHPYMLHCTRLAAARKA
jgi:hypothetical protein